MSSAPRTGYRNFVVLTALGIGLLAFKASAYGQFYSPPPDPDFGSAEGYEESGTVTPQFGDYVEPQYDGQYDSQYDPQYDAGYDAGYDVPDYPQADFGSNVPPTNGGPYPRQPQPSQSGPPQSGPPQAGPPAGWQRDYNSPGNPMDNPGSGNPGNGNPAQPVADMVASGTQITDGLFQPGEVVAMVGDQPVLAGEVMGQINRIMAAQGAKIPDDPARFYNREQIRQFLPTVINTKLLYLDFLRKLPPENIPRVKANIREQFYDKELQAMMEAEGVTTPAELDAKLRKYGSDLNAVADAWMEQAIAASIIREAVDFDPEISLPEMYADYQQRIDEYSVPAKVKWEQLMVRFDRYPSREAAWQAIAKMGNQVLGGAPLNAVAKRESQGPTAALGGSYDWTSSGGLKSAVLDEAIFDLPKDKLSRILEDDQGFHIVRVTDKQPKTFVPFRDAQKEIREMLREVKIRLGRKEYLEKLRAQTRVTTIFDEDEKEMRQEAENRNSEFVIPR